MLQKKLNKIIAMLCITAIFASFVPINVSASEYVDRYKQCLDEINKEYNLELGYVKVNPEDMTLEEYKETAIELAKDQRATLDYIQYRIRTQKVSNLT